jgi:hypothetical protein
MRKIANRSQRHLLSLVVLSLCFAPAAAELARVHLTNGTVMRGDVELTETEARIRNDAGVVICPRERIDSIEWLEEAQTVQANYMRRFWDLKPDDTQQHFELAQWLAEHRLFEAARQQCAYVLKLDPSHEETTQLLQKIQRQAEETPSTQPTADEAATPDAAASQPASPAIEPPPLLGKHDILRLKLSELALDGPPEQLSVRYLRARDERDLMDLVREEMEQAFDYDPEWERTVDNGRTYEKLPIVIKATGLKYADRIDLRGHPEVFTTYRRRVLPLVTKGCARTGCHGGKDARAFSFPAGSQNRDEFVYTSFALLDRMQTPAGPMIDRTLPEESALIRYMLPAEEGEELHPPVERGRVTSMLRSTRDTRYQMLVDWISSLRTPHPDYELEYTFPAWLEPPEAQPPQAQPPTTQP